MTKLETAAAEETKKDRPTVGEELFLVHLRRCRDEEDDHDHEEGPRKRSASTIGEELWEIHLKRSRGMEGSLDRDEDDVASGSSGNKKAISSPSKGETKCTRYNLRNKDNHVTAKKV